MNRTKKADILLEKLKADSVEYKGLDTTGYSLEEKKNAIRSLMNIRMPRELPDDFNKFIDYPYHQKLKEVRTALHMTQVEFAAFSGINRSTLSAWEQGIWIQTRENSILLAEAFQKASGIKED